MHLEGIAIREDRIDLPHLRDIFCIQVSTLQFFLNVQSFISLMTDMLVTNILILFLEKQEILTYSHLFKFVK